MAIATWLIPPQFRAAAYGAVFLCLLAVLAGIWVHGYGRGREAVKMAWDASERQAAEEQGRVLAAAVEQANRHAEAARVLNDRLEGLRHEYDKQGGLLNDALNDALGRLRAARGGAGGAAAVSRPAAVAGGNTGTGGAGAWLGVAGAWDDLAGLPRLARRCDDVAGQLAEAQAWIRGAQAVTAPP